MVSKLIESPIKLSRIARGSLHVCSDISSWLPGVHISPGQRTDLQSHVLTAYSLEVVDVNTYGVACCPGSWQLLS